MSDTTLTVALPSLIHRIGSDAVKDAKSLAENHRCSLKRVRRSRNWQLQGEATDIDNLCHALQDQDAMKYLTGKLEQKLALHPELLETTADKLKRIIVANPAITLAELVDATRCTMAEARAARLDTEEF